MQALLLLNRNKKKLSYTLKSLFHLTRAFTSRELDVAWTSTSHDVFQFYVGRSESDVKTSRRTSDLTPSVNALKWSVIQLADRLGRSSTNFAEYDETHF